MSTDDPLADAVPGETVTIDHEKTIHGINIAPAGHYGGDRESQMQMTEVEVIEDDRDGYYSDIRVRWREDVTKVLPMHLHDDPIDLAEYRRQKRIRKAGERASNLPTWVSRALSLGVGSGVTLTTTWFVTRGLDRSMTINGEAVSFGPDAFVAVVVITLLIAFVVFALPYLPRRSLSGGVAR